MNVSIDHPAVMAFVATLAPDPARDRRADTLRAAARRLARTLKDNATIRARQRVIRAELVAANDATRARLSTELGAGAGQLDQLPTVVYVSARHLAEAFAAWAMDIHARAVATPTGADAANVIDDDLRRWFPHVIDGTVRQQDIDGHADGVVMRECRSPPPPTDAERRACLVSSGRRVPGKES